MKLVVGDVWPQVSCSPASPRVDREGANAIQYIQEIACHGIWKPVLELLGNSLLPLRTCLFDMILFPLEFAEVPPQALMYLQTLQVFPNWHICMLYYHIHSSIS